MDLQNYIGLFVWEKVQVNVFSWVEVTSWPRRLFRTEEVGWMDGWMDGWVDGWMGEWVGGWMDRWVDG